MPPLIYVYLFPRVKMHELLFFAESSEEMRKLSPSNAHTCSLGQVNNMLICLSEDNYPSPPRIIQSPFTSQASKAKFSRATKYLKVINRVLYSIL